MKPLVYNASLAGGLLLIGAGVGMLSIPWALVTVGSLVITLTVFAAIAIGRR